MSNRYCPSCGHCNPPVKGILAKVCTKCNTSLVSASLSSLIGQAKTSTPAPATKPAPSKEPYMSDRARRIMEQRKNIDPIDNDTPDFDEEILDGTEELKIRVDRGNGLQGIKFGNLCEMKKDSNSMPIRGKGSVRVQDILGNLKSSKNRHQDIGEE